MVPLGWPTGVLLLILTWIVFCQETPKPLEEQWTGFQSNSAKILLGGYDQGKGVTEVAGLTAKSSFCPKGHLPPLPSARHLAFAAYLSGNVYACGGKENRLMLMNTECWKLNLTAMSKTSSAKWEPVTSLPRAMAGGSTALASEDLGQIWILGGSVEEDYYDGLESAAKKGADEYNYYDYVVEKPGNSIWRYEAKTDSWYEMKDLETPLALEGSCVVRVGDKMYMIGGKDEKGNIQDGVWILDIKDTSKGWTKMDQSLILSRFYHGCTNVTLHGRTGLAVAGGRGNERNTSSTVEIFMLGDVGKQEWTLLPPMTTEHPNVPALTVTNQRLAVIGGGEGHQFSEDGYNKVEIFDGKRWLPFSTLDPGRIFSSSVTVPDDLLRDCRLEPNLGIYRYFQAKTQKSLGGQVWVCDGNDLRTPDDRPSDVITDSCTIPGCNYPHIFKQQSVRSREGGLVTKGRQLIRRRKTRLSCQLKPNEKTAEAKSSDGTKYVLECSMQCRHNWYPKGGRNSTTCNLEQVKKFQESGVKKLTNFTTDYLECVQKP